MDIRRVFGPRPTISDQEVASRLHYEEARGKTESLMHQPEPASPPPQLQRPLWGISSRHWAEEARAYPKVTTSKLR